MNKAYSNIKPNIYIETSGIYSMACALSEICPVDAVIISDLPAGKFNLSVALSCEYKGKTVFSYDEKTFYDIETLLFAKKDNHSLLIRFDYKDFDINYDFLKSTDSSTNCAVKAVIKVDGTEYFADSAISVLPKNVWNGTEIHPETLCAFCTPDSKFIKAITENVKPSGRFPAYETVVENVRNIVKNMRSRNVICAKRESYSPEKKQTVNVSDVSLLDGTVVCTPLELAVIFVSCMERFLLPGEIVFVKNTAGITNVFCGVRFYSENATAVSESKTKILSEMANNEILLFDPAILSSAQNIDVMLAKEAVYNYISRPETEIMLSLDVLACRKSGVKNAHAVKPLDVGKIKFTSAREALGDVYVGLENTKEFKLLEGDYLSFDVLPVIGKYETLCGIGENEGIFVHPLEINEKIDVYSGLADGFCSFALKDVKKIAYNKAELAAVSEKYNYFRNRISNNNYVTCALYENPFHNKISKMTFAAGKNYRTYVVCGFVRATKKDSGETRFIPLCFVKAELELEGSYKLKITDKEPIMNPLLLSYISSGEVDASAVKNAYDAASYVERLILKNKPSLEKNFSKTEVVREAALVNADFSPVYLWRNIKAYGKKYLNSGLVNAYLSGKTLAKYEEPAREYVFSHYVDNLLEEKLLSSDSLVVSGDGDVSSKIAIASNKIAYNAFAGKKTLLVSSDEGFVSETENNLKELGLSALVLKPESTSSEEIVSRMREKIDEVGREYTLNRLLKIPDGYKSTKKALSDYSDSVISSANEFGMSLSDAAESYIGANTGIENEAVLETDKKAFEGENALNDMFGIAEELIVEAEKALKDAGLEKYEPVSRHPLFAVRKNVKTDERLEKGFDVIDKIISILSDYRESFLEIEDEINIGISEIKTQKALMALNELYKTVISARELDIPSGFTENDISVFADNSENLAKAKDRLENIEFQLRFMNKEIFEDVDILLSDFSYNDGHNENFIKKYLIKKNNKDVLLQYVSPENRPEFNQHGIEGVYKLLSEYRKIRLSLDGYKNKVEYSENNVKLANFIKNVETELKNIYPDASGEFINKKTRKIFDFIEKVAKKPSVSKSLTYARASLTEVFSENDCLIKVLSETLNVDFEDFVFDTGILSYDGLTKKLKDMKTDKSAYDSWNGWLGAKEKASGKMDSFTEYIEKYGITGNIDRIFAKSLILPAYKILSGKIGFDTNSKQFDSLKDKYLEEFANAKDASRMNSYHAHMQKIKFFAETEDLSETYSDAGMPVNPFVSKHLETLMAFFPCIIVSDAFLPAISESGKQFDTVIFNEAEYKGVYALPVLSTAFSALVAAGKTENELSEKLFSSGALKYISDKEGKTVSSFGEKTEIQMITVNGSMRKNSDGANPQEAEACLAKALEFAEKSKEKFCIYTFTNGQAAYIKHLMSINHDKGKLYDNGTPVCKVICAADGSCESEKFTRVIVSVGAAPGANGICGWNFFGADDVKALINKVFSEDVKEAAVISSLTLKDFAKLRRTGKHAEELYFLMYALHSGAKLLSADEDAFSKSNVAHKMLEENASLSRAGGKYGGKADFVDVQNGTFYMYDCAFGKDILERISAEEELKNSGYNAEFIPSAKI